MASTKVSLSPPPTPPLKDICRDTPSPGSPKRGKEKMARASSPETCPICLDEFHATTDRAYSNNCYHIFCFECLLEWSKNKRECPLCKKPFVSIIHKFKDNGGNEVYRLPPPFPTTSVNITPLISVDWMSQMRRQFIQHRNRHLDRVRSGTARLTALGPRNPMRPHTTERRRFLYQHQLYCEGALTPGGARRYRRTTPEFYRTNPAMMHRLVPWLNRELVAILPSPDNVDFVQSHILSEIKRIDMRSLAFKNSIRRFTLQYTDQFIHEFHMYAMSPLSMEEFDTFAKYPIRPRLSRGAASGPINLHPDRSQPAYRNLDYDGAEGSQRTTEAPDSSLERGINRRWHRQVLAEEQARRHLGIYPAPRRRSGFVLNAVESTSDAPAIPRRRSGLVLSSADGGIHPSISSGLDRNQREGFSNQQRLALNRLERSLRRMEGVVSEDVSALVPHPIASALDRPFSALDRNSSATDGDSASIDRPSAGVGGHIPDVREHPRNSSSLSSTTPLIFSSLSPTQDSDGHEPTQVALSRPPRVPGIMGRVRNFLALAEDESNEGGTPNTAVMSSFTEDDIFGRALSQSLNSVQGSTEADRDSSSIFPFYRTASSSSLSADSSVEVSWRTRSPSLSSHSSDVILVSEERPYRARTPILLSSSESEAEDVKEDKRSMLTGRHLSSSSDEEEKRSSTSIKASKSTGRHNRLRVPYLSRSSSVEDDRQASAINIRVVSESSDSDCLVTFEAARLKSLSKRKSEAEPARAVAADASIAKKKKMKNRAKEKETKKSKKRKSRHKESKHNRHILANISASSIARAAASRVISTSTVCSTNTPSSTSIADSSGESNSWRVADQDTRFKLTTSGKTLMTSTVACSSNLTSPTSGITSLPSGSQTFKAASIGGVSCSSPRASGSKAKASGYEESTGWISSPILDVTTVDSDIATDGSHCGEHSYSQASSMTRMKSSEDEGRSKGLPAVVDDWFLDYSKSSYKHPEPKAKKSSALKNIRKHIRYFAKTKIAQKYEDKTYKKHDKGHKN
ncbi:E3 ubiquitin-protein ligase Topors-like [Watersipora subatra]|uniref:E3 ubiquitin-protein ligase Topors-like n=1 Tax=Watersipora subatra TaxID=2589382 RepID=UPI00355ADB7B